jgi:transposase InsO family protein
VRASIVVRSRAHGFSPALLRGFAQVLLPCRPGAAEAFLGPRRAARKLRDDGLRGAGRHGGREALQRRALQGHRGPTSEPPSPLRLAWPMRLASAKGTNKGGVCTVSGGSFTRWPVIGVGAAMARGCSEGVGVMCHGLLSPLLYGTERRAALCYGESINLT